MTTIPLDLNELNRINEAMNKPPQAVGAPAAKTAMEPKETKTQDFSEFTAPAAKKEEEKPFEPSFIWDPEEFIMKGYVVKEVKGKFFSYMLRSLTNEEMNTIYSILTKMSKAGMSQSSYDAEMEQLVVGACIVAVNGKMYPLITEYKNTEEYIASRKLMVAKFNIALTDEINSKYVDLYRELRLLLSTPDEIEKAIKN